MNEEYSLLAFVGSILDERQARRVLWQKLLDQLQPCADLVSQRADDKRVVGFGLFDQGERDPGLPSPRVAE